MKLYIHTAEARVARFSATEKFFRDFYLKNMKLEFEYLTQTFKDGIWYKWLGKTNYKRKFLKVI